MANPLDNSNSLNLITNVQSLAKYKEDYVIRETRYSDDVIASTNHKTSHYIHQPIKERVNIYINQSEKELIYQPIRERVNI